MSILALDQSYTSTGYAVLDESLNVLECGKVCTTKDKLDSDKINSICNKCKDLINTYNVNKIILEEQYVKRNMRTALKLSRLFGAIMYFSIVNQIELVPIEPSKIRKILLDNGKADKEEVAEYVIQFYKECPVVKSVGPYSDKNNKKKTSDIYDAISIGMSYLIGMKNGEEFRKI